LRKHQHGNVLPQRGDARFGQIAAAIGDAFGNGDQRGLGMRGEGADQQEIFVRGGAWSGVGQSNPS